jgi:hypothetical protein
MFKKMDIYRALDSWISSHLFTPFYKGLAGGALQYCLKIVGLIGFISYIYFINFYGVWFALHCLTTDRPHWWLAGFDVLRGTVPVEMLIPVICGG